MSESFIILDLTTRSASFTPVAEKLRDEALESSALIGRVGSAEENLSAVEAQKKLSGTINAVEKARKAAKEPILDLGRDIDGKAKKFIEDIESERNRLSGLIGDFQELEIAKQRAAEAKARLEAEAVERARQVELKRIADEEAAKRAELDKAAAEAAAKAREATSAKAKEEAAKLQADIDRQRALAEAQSVEDRDRANSEADMRAQAAQQKAAETQPARAEGQVVRHDWEIIVTNPYELARFHPDLVVIKPNLVSIKAALNEGRSIKGITAEKTVNATVRSNSRAVIAT